MWNGVGIFERIHKWVEENKAGGKLNATKLDEEFINVKKGLEQCLTRNGETEPSKDLNMANFRHVNVGSTKSRNHYATAGETQDHKYNYGEISKGRENEYKITIPFECRKLTEGQKVHFIAHQSNTGPAKLKINRGKYKQIVKRCDTPLVKDDILENAMISVIYDGDQFQITSLVGDPIVPIPDQITPIKSQLVSTGTVMSFAGNSIPEGWLECDGKHLNASENAAFKALFDVIGVIYGGTGVADFQIPDLRGRSLCGQDNMGGAPANRVTSARGQIQGTIMGATGGSAVHKLTVEEIPPHAHGCASKTVGSGRGSPIGRFEHHEQTALTGGGASHNNMQPTMIMKMMIKL